MTIAELGSIGEFLSSILVLLTLVYIAMQTRQSRVAAEMESSRILVADFNVLWSVLNDQEYARLVRKGINDWGSLSNNDKFRLHSFFVSLMLHWIGAREQSERLPQLVRFVDPWENNILGLLLCPGGREWFESAKIVFTEQQVGVLDRRLEDQKTLPPSWIEMMPWNSLDLEDDVESDLTCS